MRNAQNETKTVIGLKKQSRQHKELPATNAAEPMLLYLGLLLNWSQQQLRRSTRASYKPGTHQELASLHAGRYARSAG
jgi:hypothetical protein